MLHAVDRQALTTTGPGNSHKWRPNRQQQQHTARHRPRTRLIGGARMPVCVSADQRLLTPVVALYAMSRQLIRQPYPGTTRLPAVDSSPPLLEQFECPDSPNLLLCCRVPGEQHAPGTRAESHQAKVDDLARSGSQKLAPRLACQSVCGSKSSSFMYIRDGYLFELGMYTHPGSPGYRSSVAS